jgi:acyl carrier protein
MSQTQITELVIKRTAELADVPPEQITDETTLESLGLDSSDAVILAMELEELTGREIDVGIFLRFETLRAACDEIERIVNGGDQAAAASTG